MITSTQNRQVKQWRKLHTKKERTKTGTFLVEGYHLIEEAHKSNWKICEVIIEENREVPEWCEGEKTTIVSTNVFQHIAQTETPQGIIAVVSMNKKTPSLDKQLLLIDRVQDPGNLGTMIRTADAAGFSAVILGTGTVDLYNDKVIRATQGSIFHIPVLQEDLLEKIPALKQDGYAIWAAALDRARIYTELKPTEKIALIVGNEGAGIDTQVLTEADELVKIPIYGRAESLNVSVAAGILMYDLKRSLAR